MIDEYPDSPYAPKAGYAIAWILEYIVSNYQAAEKVYKNIETEYGSTEFGNEAKIKLGMAQRMRKEQTSPQGKETKESQDVLREESLDLEDIERELLEEGPIIYNEPEITRQGE